MSADYRVIFGRFDSRERPCATFQEAVDAAKELNGRVINADAVDVCEDSDCKQCNRDGLSQTEREACEEAGL